MSSVAEKAESSRTSTTHEYKINKKFAIKLSLALVAGNLALLGGMKAYMDKVQAERFPGFNPDVPSKIIGKDYTQEEHDIELFPYGGKSYIPYPSSDSSEGYILKLRQTAENKAGDKAYAISRALVSRETFFEHEVGETIVPSEEGAHIEELTRYEKISSMQSPNG